MARELGNGYEAARWDQKADDRTRVMQEKLWHAEDGVFYGRDLIGDKWARVQDISTFLPLWCGLATPEQAGKIVRLLHDPQAFGTDYPVATLAVRNMPEKKKGSYHWRGANWVEMSWLVILGLKRYGYYDEAARLAEINCRMVYRTLEDTGHFREFYNSLTGNPSDLTDYIWTSIPAAMVVDIFLGVRPTAQGLEILPALPKGWERVAIRNLHIRDHRLALRVAVEPAGETTLQLNGTPFAPSADRGATIPWTTLPHDARMNLAQSQQLLQDASQQSEP